MEYLAQAGHLPTRPLASVPRQLRSAIPPSLKYMPVCLPNPRCCGGVRSQFCPFCGGEESQHLHARKERRFRLFVGKGASEATAEQNGGSCVRRDHKQPDQSSRASSIVSLHLPSGLLLKNIRHPSTPNILHRRDWGKGRKKKSTHTKRQSASSFPTVASLISRQPHGALNFIANSMPMV